jgi:hypothetical protein
MPRAVRVRNRSPQRWANSGPTFSPVPQLFRACSHAKERGKPPTASNLTEPISLHGRRHRFDPYAAHHQFQRLNQLAGPGCGDWCKNWLRPMRYSADPAIQRRSSFFQIFRFIRAIVGQWDAASCFAHAHPDGARPSPARRRSAAPQAPGLRWDAPVCSARSNNIGICAPTGRR